MEAISQIEKLNSEVKKLKSKDKKIIEKVREKKKIAPLVPINEFVEGLSDSEFKALEKEIEEVDGIYNTSEYKTFLELKQKIEKLRDDYDKKIADAHHEQEEKSKKEHLKKLRKVLQDTIENASY